MTLRLKINLIVGALTLLFLAAVLALQLRSMRDSVHEEVVAANRVAAQLLDRTVWRYAAQGTPAMLSFLQGIGRVRSNDITLLRRAGPGALPLAALALQGRPRRAGLVRGADLAASRRCRPSSSRTASWKCAPTPRAPRSTRGTTRCCSLAARWRCWSSSTRWCSGWWAARCGPSGRSSARSNELQRGRFDVALPPLQGREAGAIGVAFNRMVGELQRHIETERRAVRAELQLSDSRELTRWIDHHIEQERRMIARELHDELGQSVTAMRSMALSIAQRTRGIDPQAEQAARVIAEESSRLYDAMHGIIPRLTPLVLDNFGLADAINDLVERTRRSHAAVDIRVSVELGAARLPAEVALALYRAAQEGITNALRHGQASTHRARRRRQRRRREPDAARRRPRPAARRLAAQRPLWPALADRACREPARNAGARTCPTPWRAACRARALAPGERMIRVMLVDDHALVRMGFRMLLADAAGGGGGRARQRRAGLRRVRARSARRGGDGPVHARHGRARGGAAPGRAGPEGAHPGALRP